MTTHTDKDKDAQPSLEGEIKELQQDNYNYDLKAGKVMRIIEKLQAAVAERDAVIEVAVKQLENAANLDKGHPELFTGDAEYLVGVIVNHARNSQQALSAIEKLKGERYGNT